MRILHAGCGNNSLPACFFNGGEEVRLDIEEGYKPDIVASLTDMGDIGEFDAVYCSHTLEHLYPYDVPKALSEFRRVLREGGAAIVIVPDLEDVKPTEDVVYVSDAGPICGLDMYYGKASYVAVSPYMAHHCGFIAHTLGKAIADAGFSRHQIMRLDAFNLVGVGVK